MQSEGDGEKNTSLLKIVNAMEKKKKQDEEKGIVPVLPPRGPLTDEELRERTASNMEGVHKHTAKPLKYVDNDSEA